MKSLHGSIIRKNLRRDSNANSAAKFAIEANSWRVHADGKPVRCCPLLLLSDSPRPLAVTTAARKIPCTECKPEARLIKRAHPFLDRSRYSPRFRRENGTRMNFLLLLLSQSVFFAIGDNFANESLPREEARHRCIDSAPRCNRDATDRCTCR